MDDLSSVSDSALRKLFSPADQPAARRLLATQCGRGLPLCDDAGDAQLDRIRLAALRVSGGDPGRLREAVALAQRDWRDLLVEAGFAHSLTEHLRWLESISGR